MFQIAVCDDNAAERSRLDEYASAYFSLRNIPAEIDTYESGTQFLSAEKSYDLYFFDVIMPQLSGMSPRSLHKRRIRRSSLC